jgi:hypothetical protein
MVTMTALWRSIGLPVLVALAGLLSARPAAGATAIDEVLTVEQARIAALVEDDFAALDRIMSAGLAYGHSNGTLETKAEYLATLKSGRLKYKAMEHEQPVVRIFGETAVVQGTSKVRAISVGVESTVNLRFLLVYVRERGQWKFAAWQSTRLP